MAQANGFWSIDLPAGLWEVSLFKMWSSKAVFGGVWHCMLKHGCGLRGWQTFTTAIPSMPLQEIAGGFAPAAPGCFITSISPNVYRRTDLNSLVLFDPSNSGPSGRRLVQGFKRDARSAGFPTGARRLAAKTSARSRKSGCPTCALDPPPFAVLRGNMPKTPWICL